MIISNDASNKHLNHAQILPLTSKVDRLYPGEAFVTLDEQDAFDRPSRQTIGHAASAVKVQLGLFQRKSEQLPKEGGIEWLNQLRMPRDW